MPAMTRTSAPAMSPIVYRTGRFACNFIKFQCIRETVLHRERADRSGGFLLACTHISHLEPFIVASGLRRNVRWMSRIEFYRNWWGWGGKILDRGGAFPVDRFGFTLPAIRRGIQLVNEGEVVGIFPEGGVATGRDSILRGGPMKQGVCAISLRTNTPIVPVVVLGSQTLNRVGPWLPVRRARLYTAFGNAVFPPASRSSNPSTNRADRRELADRLRTEFGATYVELLTHTGLTDGDVP